MYIVTINGDSLIEDGEQCTKDKSPCLWFLVSVDVVFFLI